MAGGSTQNGQAAEAAGKPGAARLEWVDAAKGVGIILVVVAHVWTRGPVRDVIYAFHMPLFFLLSGYMGKPRGPWETLRRLVPSMAVPYVAFLLLLALFDWGFESWRDHRPMFHGWADAAWRLGLGGTELRGPFTIFWFVPCLFFARLVQSLLATRWPDPRAPAWFVIAGAAGALGLWIGARWDFSPLGLLAVPVALLLLWAGALWRVLGEGRWLLALTGAASAAILLAIGPVPLNMKVADYGVPVLSLLLAGGLSFLLCALVRLWPARPLAALGRASLVIMYLHVAVIHYGAGSAPRPVLALGALALPWLFERLVAKSRWGRRIFLGQ